MGRTLICMSLVALALVAAPASAQSRGGAQELSNCAGAVAAFGNLNIVNYPRGAHGEWAPVLGALLDSMNRTEGLEGMTGRFAANAARSYWTERPRAEQEQEANQCRARFGRQ